MFIDLTTEQRRLRNELRSYFADLVTPAEEAEMAVNRHGDAYRAVVRRMGRDGWLGVGWPKEYGGQGFGPVEQQIFLNEAVRADVPLPLVTLLTVGPTLQQFGTEEQKRRFLPGILSGDIHFAIGYSEPEAGTDLASLRTSAVRDDSGDWIVNGQKIFTTGAHEADYVWLACRTGSVDSRHRGITILIVDTNDPGYSWTPIITCDGAHHTNATYFDNVRVPANMLVGTENRGWQLITTQLNHERVSLGPSGKIEQLYDRVRDWAQVRGVLGEIDVRRSLGRIHAMVRLNELLNWQVAAASEERRSRGPAWSRSATASGPVATAAVSEERRSRGPAWSRSATASGPVATAAGSEERRSRGPAGSRAATVAGRVARVADVDGDQSQVIADASATKIYSTESLQEAGRLAEEIIGRYGDPAEADTAELLTWLDRRTKQNLVVTFGGGVNEVMRELVASSGLRLPRVPR
ncbi:acyl-CoA dehydrogenase family protein [Nocardia sp. NPDC049190]|uniref:acyl-CoA dehydrogenase family protein n=1 Tax=Nocardia sp. NPDC049190 TaxID=3155650 RepID=UPI0033C690DA